MYLESNFAKHYELEMSIRGTKQNDKSIQEFYNEMTSYWDQLALMEPAILQTIDEYVQYREKQRLVQFLMAFRDQFEPLRGVILHRSPLPSVDGVVHELIAEKTRLKKFITCPLQLTIATRRVIGSIHVPTGVSQKFRMVFIDHLHHLGHHNSIHNRQFQQYRAFMATIQGDSTQTSTMTTTHSGLHSSSPTGISPTTRIFDSGSSHRMTPDSSILSHCVTPVSPISIATANGSPMFVVSIGSISSRDLYMSDVFYVTQKQIGTGRRVGDLYVLENLHILPSSSASCHAASSYFLNQKSSPFFLWHSRAERKHRHLLDIARSLLLSSSVPSVFWGEAVLTAVYLLNRMPTPLLSGRSPYECLYGPASLRTTPFFECLDLAVLFFSLRKTVLNLVLDVFCVFSWAIAIFTLPPKTAPIAKEDLIYLDPFPSDVPIEEYSSTFDIEDIPLPTTSPEVSDSPLPPVTSSLRSLIPPAPLVYSRRRAASPIPSSSTMAPSSDSGNPDLPTRRSPARSRHSPVKFNDFTNTYFSSSYRSFLSRIHTYFEPRSYKEACNDPHRVDAMNDELTALAKTQTWELTPLPDGKNIIGCKWVYKVKTHSDGSMERYKARLVAKGFFQEYGIDYEETFAPVAKMTAVRTLIFVAAVRQWSLYQFDVKNAFLNGYLSEEVYMRPPPGLSPLPGLLCRLRRALYGLKQSPRAWYARFQAVVLQIGFQPSVHDSALFVRHTSHGLVVLLLYVDDIIITGSDSDSAAISDVKNHLFREFEMKDLGQFRYFLGIEVASSPKGCLLSQIKYITDILHRANLTDDKPVDTPLELHAKFSATDGVLIEDPTLYRELVPDLDRIMEWQVVVRRCSYHCDMSSKELGALSSMFPLSQDQSRWNQPRGGLNKQILTNLNSSLQDTYLLGGPE
ncbi:hypothetical protein Acr_00g0051640 [Actinidia rufa]|uniref:Reverse transcriptase Ty1/copia-type domain-containing protein n=1 Tax=Actinidia rufa TaxID=165716 RepID=A0A7J0DKV1_9ERIC|nr:hypothetical protein Acr_00g0051640 [Actinidia rufa]